MTSTVAGHHQWPTDKKLKKNLIQSDFNWCYQSLALNIDYSLTFRPMCLEILSRLLSYHMYSNTASLLVLIITVQTRKSLQSSQEKRSKTVFLTSETFSQEPLLIVMHAVACDFWTVAAPQPGLRSNAVVLCDKWAVGQAEGAELYHSPLAERVGIHVEFLHASLTLELFVSKRSSWAETCMMGPQHVGTVCAWLIAKLEISVWSERSFLFSIFYPSSVCSLCSAANFWWPWLHYSFLLIIYLCQLEGFHGRRLIPAERMST